jgi:hypothetical protein
MHVERAVSVVVDIAKMDAGAVPTCLPSEP